MADGDSRRVSVRRRGPGRLAVDVVSAGGVRAPGLGRWLAEVAPARARGSLAVAIVPDARIRALNRQYRRTDAPTDVLSFPSDERGYLGDVVIAAGVARRQARAAGHSLQTELRVLALHGLLHLLGYDHEHDEGRMARVERRLRRRGGLAEGLIERGGLELVRDPK
jgi:probable rRNA maturation factor